jgi:hypothetical protein
MEGLLMTTNKPTRGISWQHTLERLSERDLQILDHLEWFRMLTTRQLQRLHFQVSESAGDGGHASDGAATKATTRAMNRLLEHQVVAILDHRRGGHRAGSRGLIWQLAPKGSRIQQERLGRGTAHRYVEPGAMFIEHILGVADLAITVFEAQRHGLLEVLDIEAEPTNWRTFLGPHMKTVTVKPDLTLVTASGSFEEHWFIEYDRASEHLPKVIGKCRTYVAYAATGAEQTERGVFPRVLWVVPDEHRQAAIQRAIESERDLPNDYFVVCTVDRFAEVITSPTPEGLEDDGT